MLSSIVIVSLARLGAHSILTLDEPNPTTEEEFARIRYRPAEPSISWEAYQAEYARQIEFRKAHMLRAHRNVLLQKSDWVIMNDVFNTLENKAEWIAYRQALRDLPLTLTEYVWVGTYDSLDFARMNIPVAPPLVRTPATN